MLIGWLERCVAAAAVGAGPFAECDTLLGAVEELLAVVSAELDPDAPAVAAGEEECDAPEDPDDAGAVETEGT